MKKAIIVDIDGTLADISHRVKYLEQTPKDWKNFFQSMKEDKVNIWCKTLVQRFKATNISVLLVSGRPDNYFKETVDWLGMKGIYYDNIFMRKAVDYREDFIVKREIYDTEIKGKYDVLFCIDDRNQVVNMWRANGLTCLQCKEGDF
jgi:hypothetical protein